MTKHHAAAAATFSLALLATGCAKSPESISASYVSTARYETLGCARLVQERANLETALDTVSNQQRQARNSDIVGVVLIGLPVSTLSGSNVATDVARLKGELNAVSQVIAAKGCATS